MTRRFLAVFLAAFVLSGCSEPPAPAPNGDPSLTSTTTSSSSGGVVSEVPPVFQLPSAIAFTECTGGASLFDTSADLYPGRRPPGWEESAIRSTSIDVRTFSCQRMAVGPFERGPIQIAIEHHSNFHLPESCGEGDFTYPQVMSFIHVSDADIAGYLAGSLGMPASAATFTVSQTPGPASIEEWSWQPEGSEPYVLRLPITDLNRQFGHLVERVIWFNATNLGYMDLDLEIHDDTGGPTSGSMGAESAYRQGGARLADYAALGGTSRPLVTSASLHLFRDFNCTASF